MNGIAKDSCACFCTDEIREEQLRVQGVDIRRPERRAEALHRPLTLAHCRCDITRFEQLHGMVHSFVYGAEEFIAFLNILALIREEIPAHLDGQPPGAIASGGAQPLL